MNCGQSDESSCKGIHGSLFIFSPNEGYVVLCELYERARDGSKVLNPDANSSCSAKKTVDFSLGLTWGPVTNLGDFGSIRNTSFICTGLSDNDDFRMAHKELLSRDCGSSMLEAVQDVIYVVTMFPNKMADVGILRDCFIRAIWLFVTCVWAQDIDVILKVGHNIDLVLEDECNIILKNSRGVCPTLWKYSEAKHPEWCLECCEIRDCFARAQ